MLCFGLTISAPFVGGEWYHSVQFFLNGCVSVAVVLLMREVRKWRR